MAKSNGNQSQCFKNVIEEAFGNHNKGESDWRYNVFVKLGEYVNYIEILEKYFSRESIYILRIEDFNRDRLNQFNQLCYWLGITKPAMQAIENQHNSHKVAKSVLLTKIVSAFLSESSIIKRALKKLIPLEKQAILGDKIRNLTKRKAEKEPLDYKTKQLLESHYEPFQIALTEKYIKKRQS
jgi:hypothetical protein